MGGPKAALSTRQQGASGAREGWEAILCPLTHTFAGRASRVGASGGRGAGVAGTPQTPPGRLDRSRAQGELVAPGNLPPPRPLGAQSAAGGPPIPRGLFAPPLRTAWSRPPAAGGRRGASTYLSGPRRPPRVFQGCRNPGRGHDRAWRRR